MQNNYFDHTHPLRPYAYSLEAMPDTEAPDNALRGEMPKISEGYWPAENNGKWINIENHKGEEGYVNGEPFTISDYGPYPEGWSDVPPEMTEEEKVQRRLLEIDARLDAIDRESIRPLRAITENAATEDDRRKLAELEAEAAVLRAERGTLSF